MSLMRNACIASFALSVVTVIGGCASVGKCDGKSCASDAKITADVQAKLDQMADFGPPGSIHVQTEEGVVYLDGLVTGGLAKRLAESVATRAPGVVRVVDSISVEHD
jgi:osmotically-inducible protein OsmY